jgi:hypothetical protein
MKSIVLIFFLLSCALPLWAEETADSGPEPDVQSQRPLPGGEGGAPTVPWPRPFTPSQEIGADSQISFPTDI